MLAYTRANQRKFYLTLDREREMEDSLNLITRLFPSTPLLDVGASEGRTYRVFKRLGLTNEYLMTELDELLALNLKQKFPEVSVIQASASYLPFRKNSLNVLSLNVINWKPINQNLHLSELERVSKNIFAISLYSKLKDPKKFKPYLKFSKRLVNYCRKNFSLIGKYEDEIGILELYVKIKA